MDKAILIVLGVIVLLAAMFFIILIKKHFKTKWKDSDYYSQDNVDKHNIPNYDIDTPILTNHARIRIAERLNISDNKQKELMNAAFKYGKDSNRTTGDLKTALKETEQKAEQKYKNEAVAKFYNGAIFIFTKEENKLITVYRYNTNRNDYYWH